MCSVAVYMAVLCMCLCTSRCARGTAVFVLYFLCVCDEHLLRTAVHVCLRTKPTYLFAHYLVLVLPPLPSPPIFLGSPAGPVGQCRGERRRISHTEEERGRVSASCGHLRLLLVGVSIWSHVLQQLEIASVFAGFRTVSRN